MILVTIINGILLELSGGGRYDRGADKWISWGDLASEYNDSGAVTIV